MEYITINVKDCNDETIIQETIICNSKDINRLIREHILYIVNFYDNYEIGSIKVVRQ